MLPMLARGFPHLSWESRSLGFVAKDVPADLSGERLLVLAKDFFVRATMGMDKRVVPGRISRFLL